MSNNDLQGVDPTGTIPVPEATKWAENWRNYLETAKMDFNVRSYLIPISSLANMLANNPDAEAVRAYIGLADPNDITTTQLMFVPIVDGHEVPYLPSKGSADGDGLENPGDDSNIYDMTKSCPPECGPGGELEG